MTRVLAILAIIVMAASCSGDNDGKPESREEAAARRVRPVLERDLKASGLHFGDAFR